MFITRHFIDRFTSRDNTCGLYSAVIGLYFGGSGYIHIYEYKDYCPSQWPRGLRRRSAAARLLRLWVWIPPGAWMFVCCECCVLRRADHSSRGVLPTVARHCVWSRNLVNEEAMARVGLLRKIKKDIYEPAMVIIITKLMRSYACFLSFSGKSAH